MKIQSKERDSTGCFRVTRVRYGRVRVHAPLWGTCGSNYLILQQHLGSTVQQSDPSRDRRAIVCLGEVGDPIGGWLAWVNVKIDLVLNVASSLELGHRAHGSRVLVQSIHQDRVLPLCTATVVEPSLAAWTFGREIAGSKIVIVTQLTCPSFAERIEREITRVQIAVGLVTSQVPGFDWDEEPIGIGPWWTHRDPGIAGVAETAVEIQALVPPPRDLRVIPEHTHRVSRIGAITLIECVSWDCVASLSKFSVFWWRAKEFTNFQTDHRRTTAGWH